MRVDVVRLNALVIRRRCECCEFPTLPMPDELEFDADWSYTPTACDLCEWESRPLDFDGNVRNNASSDADRNDGLSIERAREHFGRFLSIYDPNDLPQWKMGAQSAIVLERRRALRAAYAGAEMSSEHDRPALWSTIFGCEGALRQALAAEQADAEELNDRDQPEDDTTFDGDPELDDDADPDDEAM